MSRTKPVSATQSAGYTIKGALWNAGPLATAQFLLNPPICRVYQTGSQSLATSTVVPLSFNNTSVDSDSGHSNSTNNSRYTCQVAGWYWVDGFYALNGGAASRMSTSIAKNGTQVTGSMQTGWKANDLQAMRAGTVVQLAVGDYVQVFGFQSSGGSVPTFNGSDISCCMNVFFIHS